MLALVLVISLAISIMASGIIDYSLTERRLNVSKNRNALARYYATWAVSYSARQATQTLESQGMLDTYAADSMGNSGRRHQRNAFLPIRYEDFVRERTRDLTAGLPAGNMLEPEVLTGEVDPAIADYIRIPDNVRLSVPVYPAGLQLDAQETIALSGIDSVNARFAFDPLNGMQDASLRYESSRIERSATITYDDGSTSSSVAECQLEIRYLPIFSYRVFYMPHLEIFADQNAIAINGRVHTNGNLYLEGRKRTQFKDVTTAAGRFYRNFPFDPQSRTNGDIRFYNISEDQVQSISPSKMDSQDPDWTEYISNTYHGGIMDKHFDIKKMQIQRLQSYRPEEGTTERRNQPYRLIEPVHSGYNGNSRFVNMEVKAGLVFEIDGNDIKAYKQDLRENPIEGQFIECTSSIPPGIIGICRQDYSGIETDLEIERYQDDGSNNVEKGLYDFRERKEIDLITIDFKALHDALNNSSAWGSGYQRGIDWNGVVYIKHPVDSFYRTTNDDIRYPMRDQIAVQVINADTDIPHYLSANSASGITLATNMPLYLVGNVNNNTDQANRKPCCFMADAITVLSSNWSHDSRRDSRKNLNGNLNIRHAKHTTLNCDLVAGISPSTQADDPSVSTWSGGLTHFTRFLENWSPRRTGVRRLNHAGASVCLYESLLHTAGMHRNSGAPNFKCCIEPDVRFLSRPDYLKEPPGTPVTQSFRKGKTVIKSGS